MTQFAQLDANNLVLQVILADQAFIDAGRVGDPAGWVAVLPAGAAGVGFTYDRETGSFAAPVQPGPSADEAKAELRAMINAATASILSRYPAAEPLSWPAKEAEARTFLALEEPSLADCGLLLAEVAAELNIATGVVTHEQLVAKAEAVVAKANVWRPFISTLAGLRQRYEAAIDAAEDGAARRAAVVAARVEIVGLSE